MPDSIAGASDAELLSIATNMVATIATPAAYGLTAAQVTELSTQRDNFDNNLTNYTTSVATTRSKRELKDANRTSLEDIIRTIRNMAKAAHTSDALMAALGLPSGAASLAATRPVATVDTRERMRHTISWSDAEANGNRKRPSGAMGAEIWVKIDGPPPGSEKDCSFLAMDSASPYLAEYTSAEGGKTAHYLLRWKMRDGSLGAWSETVSATITA